MKLMVIICALVIKFKPMKHLFIPALAAFFLIACGDGSGERTDGFSEVPKTAEDSLFRDVMEGHDIGMARMGKIAGYRKKIAHQLDSIAKLSPAVAQQQLRVNLEQLDFQLKSAEDGMNEWMDGFVLDSAQDEGEKRLSYLQSEKYKVNQVRDRILEAVQKADSLIP